MFYTDLNPILNWSISLLHCIKLYKERVIYKRGSFAHNVHSLNSSEET